MKYTVTSDWEPSRYESGGIKLATFREPTITAEKEPDIKTARTSLPTEDATNVICRAVSALLSGLRGMKGVDWDRVAKVAKDWVETNKAFHAEKT